MMLQVYNNKMKKIGMLQNAFDVVEDTKINSINYLTFNLPDDDPKMKLIEPFGLIETDNGLYRILPQTLEEQEFGIVKIECEHVIATLIDDVIDGDVIIGNIGIYTKEVIENVLNRQLVKRWKLGKCEFTRQFEYAWENETLLSALWSIPKPLADDYIWDFDTSTYPWTINLLSIDKNMKPQVFIVPKKNQIRLRQVSEPKNLFTRIIPKGYGEGVNQLTIEEVNAGSRYLQSPKYITDKYGIISRIWIDRRYENAESLRDAAQVMLDNFQEPINEYDIDFAILKDNDLEHLKLGNKIRISREDGSYHDDFIVNIKYNHDDILTSKVTMANQTQSIAGTIADLADRQRIEMSYSQGATQLYAQSIQVNSDTRNGAILNFHIPSEMRIVNKVLAKIKVESFRAYSKATEGGGATSETTSSGGGTYSSTEFGGANYPTTNYAGETIRSTSQYRMGGESTQSLNDNYHTGQHNHAVSNGVVFLLKAGGGSVQFQPSGAHHHGMHDHEIRIPGHSHEVNMREHRHSISIDGHTHRYSIPAHTHKILPGIYKFGNPSGFTLKVNNKNKGMFNESSMELDITEYLLNDKNKINRGSWQSVEIIPNDLAYISIDLILQGFVQSRGDYTV